MFGIGVPELLFILVICVMIFGAARLPEIGKALGKAINEFKKATSTITSTEDTQQDNGEQNK